ncbi:Uncharacterised protein [uncultured Clostridium sp.]|nr:Uncharacterised protein [uncultured Clostridium sp.]
MIVLANDCKLFQRRHGLPIFHITDLGHSHPQDLRDGRLRFSFFLPKPAKSFPKHFFVNMPALLDIAEKVRNAAEELSELRCRAAFRQGMQTAGRLFRIMLA